MITIIGLGPVGMLLANLLGDSGIEVMVLEAKQQLYNIPRAIALDGESIRILQTAGINGIQHILKHHQGLHFFDSKGKSYLKTTMKESNAYPSNYLMYQPYLDAALERGLISYPHIKILWGHKFLGYQEVKGKSQIQVQAIDSEGNKYTFFTDYLIGSDGANSVVRKAMKSQLQSLWGGKGQILKADAWIPTGMASQIKAVEKHSGANIAWVQMQGIEQNGFIHQRWEFQLPQEQNTPKDKWEKLANHYLKLLGYSSEFISYIRWDHVSLYTYKAAIANKWKNGRVFLIGDAAHLTPPYIGQGLNAGFRDASNLYWKLIQALNNKYQIKKSKILDTYQSERMPHVSFATKIAVGVGWLFKTDLHKVVSKVTVLLNLHKNPLTIASPKLKIKGGHWGSGTGIGTLFPPSKIYLSGKSMEIDAFLGRNWGYLSLEPIPADVEEYCQLNGIKYCHITPEIDLTQTLTSWMRKHGRKSVLIRPDRYVYGDLEME